MALKSASKASSFPQLLFPLNRAQGHLLCHGQRQHPSGDARHSRRLPQRQRHGQAAAAQEEEVEEGQHEAAYLGAM